MLESLETLLTADRKTSKTRENSHVQKRKENISEIIILEKLGLFRNTVGCNVKQFCKSRGGGTFFTVLLPKIIFKNSLAANNGLTSGLKEFGAIIYSLTVVIYS